MSDNEIVCIKKKRTVRKTQDIKSCASTRQLEIVDMIVKKSSNTYTFIGDGMIPLIAIKELGSDKYMIVFETDTLVRSFKVNYINKYNIIGALYITSNTETYMNDIYDEDQDEIIDMCKDNDYVIVTSATSFGKVLKALELAKSHLRMTFLNDVKAVENVYLGTIVNLTSKLEVVNNDRILKLKERLILPTQDHLSEILKQETLKAAHVYCIINSISSQRYGPLLEKYIRIKFNYIKNRVDDCTGDFSKNGCNVEVKVSLGGTTYDKFNFVQIRPSHDCDFYILTAFHLSHLNVDKEGDLYIFKMTKQDIKQILERYGHYAHGTVKEHGSINIEDNLPKEYALRPKFNDACWKYLMKFRVHETDLF
jgi:hypothetical protein